MDERDERRIDVSELVTTPSSNGERPLPRRQPRGLLPSTWVGRTLKVEYVGGDGLGATTTGALLELYAFGPIMRSAEGGRFALSWDRVTMLELVED